VCLVGRIVVTPLGAGEVAYPGFSTDNRATRLQDFQASDGLEPSTPSLPFSDEAGSEGKKPEAAGTNIPETEEIRQRRITAR
jgi:hypothetical protein